MVYFEFISVVAAGYMAVAGVRFVVIPSHDEKLQPDDETAVSAALLERTTADAFNELALEMTETTNQNTHKPPLSSTRQQNKSEGVWSG